MASETLKAARPFQFGATEWPGLAKLAEECGEVIQVIGKLMATGGDPAHWDGKGDLRERLMEEMGDVAAAILFVIDYNSMSRGELERRHLKKYERFTAWHRGQSTCAHDFDCIRSYGHEGEHHYRTVLPPPEPPAEKLPEPPAEKPWYVCSKGTCELSVGHPGECIPDPPPLLTWWGSGRFA